LQEQLHDALGIARRPQPLSPAAAAAAEAAAAVMCREIYARHAAGLASAAAPPP
jgi:hypothetical protein